MSSTYPVPGSEREYPAARVPDLKLRVVPNESLGGLWPHLGDLVQALVEVGAPQGVSVELDTSDRTRPGELRGGASPLSILSVVVLEGAAGAIAEAVFAAAVRWVTQHVRDDAPEEERVTVRVYGPSGDVLREVRVPKQE